MTTVNNMISHILNEAHYAHSILKKLNEFRCGALFTDAVLCVGHEEFPCHKNVLAVSSPYFQAMFTSDLKESRESRINFNEISPRILELVIDYAYSGKIEINTSNAQDMLAAAHLFQYPAIVKLCEEFLLQQLHPSNCLGIEIFAQLHCCENLQAKAHQFVLENFTSVVESDEFLELPFERLQHYISIDHIDVRSEQTVYSAVKSWVEFDMENRQKYLSELLENVRLIYLDLKVLEVDSLICESEKCLSLIQDARLMQSFHETQPGKRRKSKQDIFIQPRPSTVAKDVVVVVGGISADGHPVSSMEMYDPHKEKWFSLADLPQPVTWCSVAVLSNCIYVAGGMLDNKIISKVWKFDSVERRWHTVSPMLKARARHSAAIIGKIMYILGGVRFEGKMLNVETIECYNPKSNTWTAAGRTTSPRIESCVVPYNKTILEVGGLKGEDVVDKFLDIYCIVDDVIRPSGEQLTLPENIRFAKIVVINNVFYIIWEDLKKMIALNDKERTFKILSEMQDSRIYSGATVVNGKIYVTGGQINNKATNQVESYDPSTGEWMLEKPMIESRAVHGCVTLKMC
ncbi:kelch-like protein 21 [Biomphalaria pfeifferi]|uniref:Kelch-like protein 21 n=1 Tax=Biomphalaria pfeifferi TaxID=112525 RepID=A0AAD8BDQ3_BIOPF|nr:kelch-like protein 21 [Biomphalaria pfeifferi]